MGKQGPVEVQLGEEFMREYESFSFRVCCVFSGLTSLTSHEQIPTSRFADHRRDRHAVCRALSVAAAIGNRAGAASQQVEEAPILRATIAEARTNPAVTTEPGLSGIERSEVLRLRGEVGPLRPELAQETNL